MVVNKDSETIFLIGAGFTKAAFPQAPLNKDLLEAICNDGGKTLSKYKEEYKTTDIEILLTKLDLDATEDKEKKADRPEINAEISSYFSKYRFSALDNNIPPWLKTFSNEILKQNDSICCLNYDCLLEGILDWYGVWSPNGGYARIGNLSEYNPANNHNNICVFKIHGSENFIKSEFGDSPDKTEIQCVYVIDDIPIYPNYGTNKKIGGGAIDPEQYIIAPSFVKILHHRMKEMMLDLLDVARRARNLVIIGCGMRPEDNFLWLLLTRFLYNNRLSEFHKQLIIIDPSVDEIWKRISSYWAGNIHEFAEVVQISSGIGEGIQELGKTLGTST